MNLPRELEIQEAIRDVLVKKEIYPMIVFYTFLSGDDVNGTLGISFYSEYSLELFLDLIEYKSLCDKSGFLIISESNSVLITNGSAILSLWSKL